MIRESHWLENCLEYDSRLYDRRGFIRLDTVFLSLLALPFDLYILNMFSSLNTCHLQAYLPTNLPNNTHHVMDVHYLLLQINFSVVPYIHLYLSLSYYFSWLHFVLLFLFLFLLFFYSFLYPIHFHFWTKITQVKI